MPEFTMITLLEGKLKAAVSLDAYEHDRSQWLMKIKLFYDGLPAGETSFNLNGYTEQDAHELVKNLSKNDFIMKEIDEYLWGESD